MRRDHSVEEIELSGLDEGDVGRLCLVACAFAPDAEFVRSMRRETEGNPFFVREICSHVHEIGAANAGGGFTLESLGVPDGVKQVIGRRVEHLPEAAGRALSAAAVIGREFDLDLLIEITGDDEDDLLDLLDEAVAARVVEETTTQGLYSFVHALTREALHDSLSATRRARLHLRVAQAIERLRAARLDDYLGVLAYHYGCAGGDSTKAVEYAQRAGEQSLRQLAHEEAAQYFESGLSLAAATGAARCDLLFGLAEALRRAGDVTGARDAFIEAGAIARALGDAERLARAAIGNYRGHVFASPGWHEPAIDLLEEALTVLPDEDGPLRARVLAALGLEVYFMSNQERANIVSAAGVDMARRLGDDEALAFCLACRHTAIFDPGHLDDRLEDAAELIEVGARIGNPEFVLTGHVHRACDLLELGAGRRGPGGGGGRGHARGGARPTGVALLRAVAPVDVGADRRTVRRRREARARVVRARGLGEPSRRRRRPRHAARGLRLATRRHDRARRADARHPHACARPSRLAVGARPRPRARWTPRRRACRAAPRHPEPRQPHVHVDVDTGVDRAHRGRPPARRVRAWRPGSTRVSPPTPTA